MLEPIRAAVRDLRLNLDALRVGRDPKRNDFLGEISLRENQLPEGYDG